MKELLRTEIKDKRNKIDSNFVRINSIKIEEMLIDMDLFKKSSKIGVYLPKNNEVNTEKIIDSAIKSGKKVFLPCIEKNDMKFRRFNGKETLEEGAFQIYQPMKYCEEINPFELDMVVVPCVVVDKNGNRIGRGKGFYDKFLEKYNTPSVCLAYDFQMVDKINADSHDQKIDFIITEKGSFNKPYQLLDGKSLSNKILDKIKEKIENEKIDLKLAVIIIGNDPASELYVKIKEKKCEYVGIKFELVRFNLDASEEDIIKKIDELNNDDSVTGILVQLPTPKHLSKEKIVNKIRVDKDVDCLTKLNRALIEKGEEYFSCCTPNGIIRILEENNISLKDKKTVIVGKGYLVGKPLSLMLKNLKVNFDVYNKKTNNIKEKTKKADILISATGVPHLIKSDYLKHGSVVIDAGNSKLGGNMVGDVDFEDVKNKVSFITPVPGGVGPMTVAMLIENLLLAYHKNLKKPKFKRFNDLRKEDINFDFHMHTNFTDGHSSPEEMVKKA
ncbi:MAG: 5-formyltetrahydrofolate cyclo-ligase, partial [Candidatus Nanoarchaeia archaeon]|nr:5-formyltetrahydrofolate cyclo-ligase [Candidatus Nanoarchaeia archaeon]